MAENESQAPAEPRFFDEARRVVAGWVPRSTEAWVGTIVYLAAVLVGAFLRFYHLTAKPLHSDEGVNGWFLMNLYNGLTTHGWHPVMGWKYDPANYHGPFLYYAGLIVFLIFKPSVFTLRVLPAIAGTGCLLLLWPLRKWLTWAGLALAVWLMAISPPFVFFSRTAIHEIYVFFFSLAAFVCLVRCYEGAGKEGNPTFRRNWLLFGVIAAAFVETNKETSVITYAAFVLAGAVAWFGAQGWGSSRRRLLLLRDLRPKDKEEWSDYLLALAWGLAICVILYTSFFNNLRGAIDMVGTYFTWGPRGQQGAGHEKPWPYWIELLREYDAPILWTALGGTVLSLLRRDRFSLFVTVWAWFLWGVYTKIHYKTPWCNLNFTGPACLLGGIFLRELLRLETLPIPAFAGLKLPAQARLVATAAMPLLVCLWPVPAGPVIGAEGQKVATWSLFTWDVNLVHYDDDRYKIVYVQTVHDFETLIGKLTRFMDAKKGEKVKVWVTSADYWPMPFYLRDYDAMVGYHQGVIPKEGPNEPPPQVVVASSTQEGELASLLSGYRVEHYMLRPGVVLTLYAQPAAWDPIFGAPAAVADPPKPPEDPKRLSPGLVGEYRYGIGCTGEVLARRVDAQPEYGGEEREFRAPICIDWRGFFQVEEAGDYGFSTLSDDGSWLWLDGELVVDNGGAHGPVTRDSVVKHLAAGPHALEVKYFDAGGGAVLQATFHKAGAGPEDLAGHVVHDIAEEKAVARAGSM